ncbi:Thioesterase superfamily protein [compost metagenome]|uniref:PaaI family thioesterase n=1 Tax=Cupriavidus campinensis TaxID=151783 RepID=A0AAE9I089_9BURK|nr:MULTISPECIES: PaaI family thioesterase [Cupriavidus]TSP11359.1 PaaI family thioesterase [Cupriavidus campinensis]URF03160.1 PaaI family thioesterase [Cupriavidus campinensis]CAG2154249.1 hypothetical protein LMG19282_04585 [Cupriavidus campinensis]
MSVEDVLAQWQADEERVRAQLAPVGLITRDQLRARSGAEFFDDILSGKLPGIPIGNLVGFLPVAFEVGRVVFQGTPGPEHYNPLGTVHGGYAATLLDSCVGCAVHSMLPAGKGYTTLELKVNYVRPLTSNTGPVRAEGNVVSLTNQIGIAEGRLTDAQGKLYAYATTTCLLFPLPA